MVFNFWGRERGGSAAHRPAALNLMEAEKGGTASERRCSDSVRWEAGVSTPRRGAAPSGLPVGSGLNAGEGEFEVGMEWVGSDDPERDAKGAGR